MRRSIQTSFVAIVVAATMAAVGMLSASATAGERYLELLRSDVRTQKVAVITEVMGFTEEESAAFWPIYRAYEVDIGKLFDARIELIKDYAQNYGKITDQKAREIVKNALTLQKKRISLQKKYFNKFDRVLPSKTVAKFLQLENMINLLVDVQIASELPLIE